MNVDSILAEWLSTAYPDVSGGSYFLLLFSGLAGMAAFGIVVLFIVRQADIRRDWELYLITIQLGLVLLGLLSIFVFCIFGQKPDMKRQTEELRKDPVMLERYETFKKRLQEEKDFLEERRPHGKRQSF